MKNKLTLMLLTFGLLGVAGFAYAHGGEGWQVDDKGSASYNIPSDVVTAMVKVQNYMHGTNYTVNDYQNSNEWFGHMMGGMMGGSRHRGGGNGYYGCP